MGEKRIKIQTVEQSGLHRKMGLAFLVASLVPILVMLYVVQYSLKDFLPEQAVSHLRWLIFLMVCGAVTGFYINRRIASAISSLSKSAKEIVSGGDLNKAVVAHDSAEEISDLVKTFNRITKDLQQKIDALEQSKKLIQNLFQKVGAAITSSEKIDNLLRLVVESMVSALDAESGVLMLQEKGERQAVAKLACGVHQQILSQLTVKREEGGAQGYRFDPAEIGIPYYSLLCVPLPYHGKILGLLAVVNKKHGEGFNNDDQILLENVADQVAVAIENAWLNANAEKAYFETISALAMAVEAKDAYTRGHLKRVADYVEHLAKKMGFDEKTIQMMKDGAFLHDIGKIAIPDHILLKPGKLTPDEMKIMKEHTTIGENIIAPLSSFKELRAMVRHHQEWFDGSGYPDRLKGDEIPIGARILAVADVYDALTTDRPYRKAFSHDVVMKMMRDEAGTHFDPKLMETFVKMREETLQAHHRTAA